MWRKTVIAILAISMLLVIGSPAVAHNGKILYLDNPVLDEHPWGGENFSDPDPFDEPSYLAGADITYGPQYFIRVALYGVWTGVRNVYYETFKTGGSVTVEVNSVSTSSTSNNTSIDPER